MSSLLSSRDSPRRDPRRRRTGRQPLVRSNSFLGAIKNIVTAPLSWFATSEDFEDTPGKRRRNPEVATRDDRELEEGETRAKRKRVHSPSPEPLNAATIQTLPSSRTRSGYLDVPEQLLGQNGPRSRAPGMHNRASSVNLASRSDSRISRMMSPSPSMYYAPASGMARTMSMDPPMYAPRRDSAIIPPPISRDVSMESVMSAHSHDSATSPIRTHFQLRSRTSATPQPTNLAFGPMPQHRERDVSEPPPLDALISNPVFVKPPTQIRRPQEQRSTETTARKPSFTTLGSIAESHQRGRSPSGYATLMLGSQTTQATGTGTATPSGKRRTAEPSDSVSPENIEAYGRSVNAAEKALHDLDVYKTPLLPSRLRGSSVIPDMFKQKRLSVPAPIRNERDKEERPRLGMAEKQKEKVTAAAQKPYAGQGGMRKLLAKRRMEEEEEREKERESAIEEDQDEFTEKEAELSAEERTPERPSIRGPDFSTISVGGREQSSLRVGRTRTSRNHIDRPAMKSKNRFSAVYDEDEADDLMNTADEGAAEEPTKKAEDTFFKPPPGFSFAKEAPPIKQDGTAKEPPIAVLPFSLSAKPTAPLETRASASIEGIKPPFGDAPIAITPPPVVTAGSAPAVPATAPPTPLLATVPSISLIPPTPGPPAPGTVPAASVLRPTSPLSVPAPLTSTTPAPSTPSGVPNFFANSSIFSKPGVSIAPPSIVPPSFTPAASSATEAGSAKKDATTTLSIPVFGTAATTATTETKASLFGKPSEASPASLFSASNTATPSSILSGQGSAIPVSVFGAKPATDAPTSIFGSSAAKGPVTSVASSGGLFAEKNSASPTSVFGSTKPQETAPPKDASALAPSPLAPAATIAPSSTFGSFLSSTTPAKDAGASATPLFGSATATSTTSTPATRAFSFGVPAKPAETAASSAIPFSFGAPAKPAEPTATTTSSPFSFGAPKVEEKEAETKAPSAEPPKSLFGATTTSAPAFAFGAPGTTASTSEAPKNMFSFGQPATPATAPTVQAPKPTFGTSTSGSFSFGQPPSSAGSDAAAPPKSPFAFGAPATPQPAPAAKPAFSFGAPSTTPSPAPSLFGGPSSSNAADVSKPFSFGVASSTSQAVTPPRDNDEVQMEESPTRGGAMDMNGSKPDEKPANGGFMFNAPSTPVGSSAFGQSTASPFSFGSTTPTSNPFAAKTETKPETRPTLAFGGFGNGGSSAFAFGQKPAENVQPPVSPNPFGSTGGFGHTSTTPTPTATTAPAFSFGAQPATNTFGQATPGAGSAPASPSTFGAPNAFSFGTPTSATAPSNPFSFGSQPASPATTNPGLPTAPGSSSGFSFGQSSPATTQPAASPFGAAPSAEGALFTIGAASTPSNTMTGPGGRPVKRLPKRGGKR